MARVNKPNQPTSRPTNQPTNRLTNRTAAMLNALLNVHTSVTQPNPTPPITRNRWGGGGKEEGGGGGDPNQVARVLERQRGDGVDLGKQRTGAEQQDHHSFIAMCVRWCGTRVAHHSFMARWGVCVCACVCACVCVTPSWPCV
jgi:hypothetical protein